VSSERSEISEASVEPARWLWPLLGLVAPCAEGHELDLLGRRYVVAGGLLRERDAASAAQSQTSEVFGYKWGRRETFESTAMQERARRWLVERYGPVDGDAFWAEHGDAPVLLDAGCGAGYSALALFGDALRRVRYVGVDVSEAVDVAATRFLERGLSGAFLQANVTSLPLPPGSVDVVFSEGVLHHTDSTRGALLALAELLRPGGHFLFYVYRRKGPVREFTDDYVRDRLAEMDPEAAWSAIVPLTRLGQALGELGAVVDVPEDVELLGIPAGPIDVQRLFYWHVAKAYFDPALSLDELAHINFDWFGPRNAHRQSPEEVRAWCAEAGLDVEREDVQEAGITIVARKRR
jgi:SAM-dependent methyltransferase